MADSKGKKSPKTGATRSHAGHKATHKSRTKAKPKAVKAVKVKASGQHSLVRRVTMDKMVGKKEIPGFRPGDTVGVYVRIREGEKERIQLYRGVVIKIQGSGAGRSFTVRKVSGGVGVERTFPFLSPSIDRVELVSQGKVRRGKLLYLRDLRGKAAALESELYLNDQVASGESNSEGAESETAETAAKDSEATTKSSSSQE